MRIIAGEFKQRKIVAPKGSLTRPTSSLLREALFNICQSSIAESAFLDLYSGSGAVGLEALSRGAKSATFVESSPLAVRAIRENICALKVEERSFVITGKVEDVLPHLHRLGRRYLLLYADPPYHLTASSNLLAFLDTHPLLERGGQVFIEESVDLPLHPPTLYNLQLKMERSYGKSRITHFVLKP